MKHYDEQYEEHELDEQLLDPEQETDNDESRETVATVSGWGLSIAMHAVVFLLLAFVVIAGRLIEEPVPVRTMLIEAPPQQEEVVKDKVILEKVPVTIDVEVVVDPVVHSLDVVVEEVSTTEDDVVAEVSEAKGREEAMAANEVGGSGAFMALGAGSEAAGFGGSRLGGGKKRALGKYGGSRASEDAVRSGLHWFKRHQSPNGMWDVDGYPVNCTLAGPKCEPGSDHTTADGDAAMTGYAILAFLGAGYDHKSPNEFRLTTQRGLDWLVANQKADGSFGNSRNYENGVCTMALAEAYGMSLDARLREPAQRGINYILSQQNGQGDGYGGLGWNYTAPKDRNDSSVSGWCVMALKSAKAVDLDVGQGMEGSKQFFDRAWNAANNNGAGITDQYSDRSGFPYTWDAASNKTFKHDRSAIGLCIGVFLGHNAGDMMLESLANDVMARAFDEKDKNYQIATWPVNTYYLYYNTMGIFQVGGERWAQWNGTMHDTLIGAQRKADDCFNGSWDSEGTLFHGNKTGRILSTAYCVLSLQVYYRYKQMTKPVL